MKAVIYLDVPDWQIGQDVIVYFPDTMMKHCKCELPKDQVTTSTNESRIFHCEKCGYGIDDIYLSNEHDFDIYPHYCPNCGRTVKW